MNNSDELATLRRRLTDLLIEIDRRKSVPASRDRHYVGQIYNAGSIPTVASRWYATHPVTVGGSECEGCTPTLTVDTASNVPVLVLDGPMVAGDYLVADQVEGYWVTEKGQTAGGGGETVDVPCYAGTDVPVELTYSFDYLIYTPSDIPTHRYDPYSVTLTYNPVSHAWEGKFRENQFPEGLPGENPCLNAWFKFSLQCLLVGLAYKWTFGYTGYADEACTIFCGTGALHTVTNISASPIILGVEESGSLPNFDNGIITV